MSLRKLILLVFCVLLTLPAAGQKVGDTIRFEGFRDEVETGVVTDVLQNGKLFKVKRTSGRFKGHHTLVRKEEVLGRGKPGKEEQPKAVAGPKVGDAIRWKTLGGEVETGKVTKVLREGELYRVERTSGRLKGRPTVVRIKDILGDGGDGPGAERDPGPQAVPLEGKRVRLRKASDNMLDILAEGKDFWNVPAAKPFGPAPEKRVVKLAVGTGDFFDKPGLHLCGDKALVFSENGGPGKEKTCKVQVVSLVTGQASKPFDMLIPFAGSSDGGLALLNNLDADRRGVPAGPIRAYKLKPDGSHEPAYWLDLPEERGDVFGQIAMIDQKHLMVLYGKTLTVHDITTGKAVYSVNTSRSQLTVDPARKTLTLAKLVLVPSPDEAGKQVSGTTLIVFDALSGKLLGRRSFPFTFSTHALSPDGRKIAIKDDNDIVTADTSTGKVLGRLTLSSGYSKGMVWLDDQFVLLKTVTPLVIDTKTHLAVWQFKETPGKRMELAWRPDAVISVSSDSSNRHAQQFAVTPIDLAGIAAAAAKIDPDKVLAIRPGASLNLDAGGQAAIGTLLKKRFDEVGIEIDPASKLRLEATSERKTVQREYQAFRSRAVTKVDVQEVVVRLKLFDGDKVVWGTSLKRSPPRSLRLKEGQTIQEAVSSYVGADVEQKMFSRIPLPVRVMTSEAFKQLPSTTIE